MLSINRKILVKTGGLVLGFLIGVTIAAPFLFQQYYKYKAKMVRAMPLVSSINNNNEINEAISSVKQQLINAQEDPAEFYVTIEYLNKTDKDTQKVRVFDYDKKIKNSNATSLIIFHLWHVSAFYIENARYEGNPGGKCISFYYDRASKKVLTKLLWQ